ncbi:hypothetical protein EUGRSUZ_H03437 [Eucalyptus grandis]|uniref:Uncharacterized protein n=2 Tax=Eucalyptus grandis TaxID=71139 RepID=A0ACC3JUU6_EUCGR|nr:hypothetical protein EUGRSUZ_H03437 [Eucalyptus grandis]
MKDPSHKHREFALPSFPYRQKPHPIEGRSPSKPTCSHSPLSPLNTRESHTDFQSRKAKNEKTQKRASAKRSEEAM